MASRHGEIDGSCYVVSPPRDDDLESWREGIGSTLLIGAQERADEAGATEMSLWALSENAPAQAFYESHGWRRDGSEEIHPIAEAPAIRMRRPSAEGAR